MCKKKWMTRGDYEWPGMTSSHEWPWITTNDYEWPRMTTNDHEWLRMTTNDHEWPRMTTNDYEWLRMTTNDHESSRMTSNDQEWLISGAPAKSHEWPWMITHIPSVIRGHWGPLVGIRVHPVIWINKLIQCLANLFKPFNRDWAPLRFELSGGLKQNESWSCHCLLITWKCAFIMGHDLVPLRGK